MMVMRYDVERFILSVMPVLMAAFCILVISLFCPDKWIQILMEIPVWIAVIWWMWIESRDMR